MKSQTKALIVIGIILLVGIAAFVLSSSDNQESNNNTNVVTNNSSSTSPSDNTADQAKILTLAEVSEHDSENDCWTIVDGDVYDITPYVPRHPGGEVILTACGTDGTSLFNSRVSASGEEIGSGTPHSSTAQNQLASFKIGTVSQ